MRQKLVTGNDDTIVTDLLGGFALTGGGGAESIRFAGGLLGHWVICTQKAVELLESVQRCRSCGGEGAFALLAQAAAITDANAAFFDFRDGSAGCIARMHEVLRRQGLSAGRWRLDPNEKLSPGQMEEIDSICRS